MPTATMPTVSPPTGAALAEHLARVERDGFTVVPGFLDRATCARLRALADALAGAVRPDSGIHTLRHPMRAALLGELIGDAHLGFAGALVGGFRDPRLLEQVLIRTDPGAAPAEAHAWHIDWVFFPRHLERRPRSTYFQLVHALSDIEADRAPTRFVPGSHHRVRAAAAATGQPAFTTTGDMAALKRTVVDSARIDPADAVAITAREGDLVVFDPTCLHAATPNRASEPRYVLFQSFYDASDPEFGACLDRSGYRAGFTGGLREDVTAGLRGLLDPTVRG